MKRRRLNAQGRNTKRDLLIGRFLYPEAEKLRRPQSRQDCPDIRPCPYVGCRHNMYLDVTEVGTVREPDHEPWDVPAEFSCLLEIVAAGARTLEEIGQIMGITRERARQIYEEGMTKVREADEDFDELMPVTETDPKVRLKVVL